MGDLLISRLSLQAPASSGYGSPAADPITDYGAPEHDDGEIDLHNKESEYIILDYSKCFTFRSSVWMCQLTSQLSG